MRWRAFAIIVLAMMAPAAARAAAPVLVETHVEPASVVVGQQARLLIDVLFQDEMPYPPRVEIPAIDGVQIFRFESQATNIQTSLNGMNYVGQRFEFDVYPRRQGNLTLPAAVITLLGADGAPEGGRVGAPQTLAARMPPGFDRREPVIAAPAATLRAEWRPSHGPIHVGDAVTLTIRRTADTVPGLSFAAIPMPAVDGVRAYDDAPLIEDRVERGDVTGIRTDRITFVFEKAGAFVFPAVTQTWWNSDAGSPELLRASGLSLRVLPDATVSRAPNRSRGLVSIVSALTLLVVCIALILWRARRVRCGGERSPTERGAFADLIAACRQTDARRTYRAYLAWRATVQAFAIDEEIRRSIGILERAVFGRGAWTAANAKLLSDRLRRRRPARTRTLAFEPRRRVPDLNPMG